jgi:sodium/hydrogen antiporter
VFVAAVVLRGTERTHEFHADLHGFAEQIENLLVVGLLLLFGGALVSGIFDELTWRGAIVAVLVVFVVRPLSGLVALLRSKLASADRVAISFFGIRGFGSVYYLAYGLSAAVFVGARELWAIVALTMLISIAVHGVTATPAMAIIDGEYRTRRRRRDPRAVLEGRAAADG